jgi:hypothetical protein
MPSRPDLREIANNVREAFADADRETLLDVLTFVLKEYVVEGPPPMLIHQAETLSDLQGATFAQLISALQTRFDHAELAMLVVDGEQVGVRVGGVVHPLLAGRAAPAATELPRPSAGVRVVETTLAPRPPQPAATPAPAAQAPPPTRGVSVRGREAGAAPAPSPGAAPAAQAPAAPPAAQPAQPGTDKPADKAEGSGGDDASTRFGLLELD